MRRLVMQIWLNVISSRRRRFVNYSHSYISIIATRYPPKVKALKSCLWSFATLSLAIAGFYVFSIAQASQGIRTIIDIQPYRQTSRVQIEGANGRQGQATLVNLNPSVNEWYILQLVWQDGVQEAPYHLENPYPKTQKLLLEPSSPRGIVIAEGSRRHSCNLWATGSSQALMDARKSKVSYPLLCEGRVYLRNATKGHRTKIEQVTSFLREDIPGGEKVVTLVRQQLFQDAYRETANIIEEGKADDRRSLAAEIDGTPKSALLSPDNAGKVTEMGTLGIDIQNLPGKGAALGEWYPVAANPGMFISLVMPNAISKEILQSRDQSVDNLDAIEAASLVYLIAFDLQYYDLGYALGTEHPHVGWSARTLDKSRDDSLPGPDGIGSVAPLINTGLLSPAKALRTVATLTGGFKRDHGAFKYGDLALKNRGSHYGFIENGVVFSKLQPGLSTIYVLDDGTVDMKTWTETDNNRLSKIKYARQNGVPIIEYNELTKISAPGPLVNRWGTGNWSGSQDSKLRTLRAGAGIQQHQGRQFLIYAVFTSATPSAMVRIFQAYTCRYAMLLDINALEHTYLAVYRRQGDNLFTQHLLKGMREVDKTSAGQYIPRFLGFADNRDFFYLMPKQREKSVP